MDDVNDVGGVGSDGRVDVVVDVAVRVGVDELDLDVDLDGVVDVVAMV